MRWEMLQELSLLSYRKENDMEFERGNPPIDNGEPIITELQEEIKNLEVELLIYKHFNEQNKKKLAIVVETMRMIVKWDENDVPNYHIVQLKQALARIEKGVGDMAINADDFNVAPSMEIGQLKARLAEAEAEYVKNLNELQCIIAMLMGILDRLQGDHFCSSQEMFEIIAEAKEKKDKALAQIEKGGE